MINEIYVRIDGLNLSRLAQKLINVGVMISNLKIKKSYMLFSINEKYRSKLDEVCKRERKKYKIVENTKIKRFFENIPYFVGSFIPILLMFAFFYIINNLIFNINIDYRSDAMFDLTNVKQMLLDNNIKTGARKSDFSAKDIEKMILENSDNVSGCEVYYDGQNLNILIFPSTQKNEISETDLVSKYNAVITKIDAFVGDAQVKEGAVVKEGDVLIKSNGGAQGSVFGKVYFSSTRIYNEKQNIEIETGNIFETYSYSLANLVTIAKAKDCEFLNYHLEKSNEIVVKNLFIPVVAKKYVYKEVKIVEEIVPFSEVEEEIKNQLKEETLLKVPEGVQAKGVTYSVVREGTMIRVDCFVEVEMSLI